MAKQPQPDLFPSSLDDIRPAEARDGPRLWVRRLVIWQAPRQIIRDVLLRPGLNIVWSPDGGGGAMGHGGGKTSFCRLLRYCLGEDSFSSDEQRQLIGTALPDAHVGAEVLLDGQPWVVVRPIGNPRSAHYAQVGDGLDAAFQADMPNTTMRPLREAITKAIMPVATPHMPSSSSVDEAWEAALAWFTRDQECRLLDALDWRSAETQSRSPVRTMSKANRLAVVRLLLNALTPDEIEASRRAQGYSQDAKKAASRRDRIAWTREDVAEGLAENFGGNPTEEGAPDFWSQKAKAQFDAEDPDIEEKAATAERLVEEQRDAVTKIETRLEVITAERTRPASILKLIGEQLPRAELRVHDAQNPRCLSCGQIIPPESQAFIAERIAERDALSDQLTSAKDEEAALESEEQELKWKGATANQELLRRRNVAGELKEKAKRFAAAKGYVTLTTRYRMYGEAIAKAQRDVEHSQTAEAMAVREINDLREASRDTIARLSSHFNAVVQWLLTSEAQGEVTLDDAGIHPQVRQHGMLTAAAVESLKVVAFDLAALIMGLEGRAQLPGFWLHDSPREADLGLPIYDRLFELARRLEALTPVPSFQYVVTTTTRPPEALQAPPWLRLTLSSAPAEHRLFARDL